MYMSQYVHKHNCEQDASRAVGATEEKCAWVCDFYLHMYLCTYIYAQYFSFLNFVHLLVI